MGAGSKEMVLFGGTAEEANAVLAMRVEPEIILRKLDPLEPRLPMSTPPFIRPPACTYRVKSPLNIR